MSQQAISIYRAMFKTTEGLTSSKGILFLLPVTHIVYVLSSCSVKWNQLLKNLSNQTVW